MAALWAPRTQTMQLTRTARRLRGQVAAWIVWAALLVVVLMAAGMVVQWLGQQQRNSALQMAADRGDAAEVERLAVRGADVNWRMGTPPLALAASGYHAGVVTVSISFTLSPGVNTTFAHVEQSNDVAGAQL